MANTGRDNAAAYGKLVARAWCDPAFKAKLIADPQAVLREAGMAVPAGATVKVVENTGTHLHFVLPPKPVGQLSDEALDEVAGGAGPIPGKTGFWSGGASYG
jgi:Nitrile hydratase, alpha chain